MRSIGVAVAHTDPAVVDELVGAVEAADDLYLAIDRSRAAVVLAGREVLASMASEQPGAGTAVVGLAVPSEIAEVARAALRCGALDIVTWPQDRHRIRAMLRDAASRARLASGPARGKVVAVAGARGGAGATTVTAMLARALPGSLIVDLDAVGAGQAAFLADGAEPTLPEVLAAVDDLDPDALQAAASEHAAGRALCAAPRAAGRTPDRAARLLALLRVSVPIAVCDAGRAGDDATRAAYVAADVALCVCAPDLASMRGARALLEETKRPALVVLNRAERGRIGAREVARVLGDRPAAVVPADPAVRRAGEAGRFPGRGPARRALDKLADGLFEEAGRGS